MKRDMNLIATMLERTATSETPIRTLMDLDLGTQWTPEELRYHARLIVDAGFLFQIEGVDIWELSWRGHEFLDSLRNLVPAAQLESNLPDGVMSATEIVAGKSYIITISEKAAPYIKAFSDDLEAGFPESKFIILGPDATLKWVIGDDDSRFHAAKQGSAASFQLPVP